MELVTIQHYKVIECLLSRNTYYADIKKIGDNSILEKPYQIMMKHYRFLSCPIFCCVAGRRAEFYGAKETKAHYVLELNVPNKIVHLQSYYDWVDVIYFTEYPTEWDGEGASTVPLERYVQDVLNGFNTEKIVDRPIQAGFDKEGSITPLYFMIDADPSKHVFEVAQFAAVNKSFYNDVIVINYVCQLKEPNIKVAMILHLDKHYGAHWYVDSHEKQLL